MWLAWLIAGAAWGANMGVEIALVPDSYPAARPIGSAVGAFCAVALLHKAWRRLNGAWRG